MVAAGFSKHQVPMCENERPHTPDERDLLTGVDLCADHAP